MTYFTNMCSIRLLAIFLSLPSTFTSWSFIVFVIGIVTYSIKGTVDNSDIASSVPLGLATQWVSLGLFIFLVLVGVAVLLTFWRTWVGKMAVPSRDATTTKNDPAPVVDKSTPLDDGDNGARLFSRFATLFGRAPMRRDSTIENIRLERWGSRPTSPVALPKR